MGKSRDVINDALYEVNLRGRRNMNVYIVVL